MISPISAELESAFVRIKELGRVSVMETCIRQIYRSWMLKPGWVGLDIGAHKGLHTIPMSECVGPSGRVIALEANPTLAVSLAKKVMHMPQATIINAACSSEPQVSVEFYANPDFPGQSTIVRGYGNNFTEEYAIRVPCISVDSFMFDYLTQKRLSFIKIDAEGAELEILRGMKRLLVVKHPLICAEISIYLWKTHIEAFREILSDFDYCAFTITGIELTAFSNKELNDFDTPAYTLILCKRNHWTFDFASNPEKMCSLVRGVVQRALK